MSEVSSSEIKEEKPALAAEDVIFPPFPEPCDDDFEEDISEEEREHYKDVYKDLNSVKSARLHCTACDRHLGCAARNDSRMRMHPMLRTLVCHTCHTFYNSGEFDKGEDGSELYCRWCGQGGQVYCCSDCPHVFCAKCIKRNLGNSKIKEIENMDDWKCFKCSPRSLWDKRALCWALLRYCDLKNKITFKTQDPDLKAKFTKDIGVDYSECCKRKRNSIGPKKKEKEEKDKKEQESKEQEAAKKTAAATLISKIPPTIQVKKFASIIPDESPKAEKKAPKRSLSKNTINPFPTISSNLIPPHKKIKMTFPNPYNINDRKNSTYTTYTPRIKPKPNIIMPKMTMMTFNGFNNLMSGNIMNNSVNSMMNHNMMNPNMMSPNMMINDNINLSLDSLTQGLDMNAALASQNDDVVCTPDFPLEPMCEVTEEANEDDDVQCITPAPIAAPRTAPPPPIARPQNILPDLKPENIIQMTDNDVTVNAVTGGLKFRVDPQTLSSNKMYRLPDGRIFAINANPNMPGGYSATIVAVTDNSTKSTAKGATFAAKLSSSKATPPPVAKVNKTSRKESKGQQGKRMGKLAKGQGKDAQGAILNSSQNEANSTERQCDMSVPVEWYRYNLIDAIDSLEYSLTRLRKLKKEATTMFLRTRNMNEMRNLHHSLERLLNNSSSRFIEVRDNLTKGFKHYIQKKAEERPCDEDDDDDDVEILPSNANEDPIFIDENSLDSNNANAIDNGDVELVGSDINDSNEKNTHDDSTSEKVEDDPLCSTSVDKVDSVKTIETNTENSSDINSKRQDEVEKDTDSIKNQSAINSEKQDVVDKDTDDINNSSAISERQDEVDKDTDNVTKSQDDIANEDDGDKGVSIDKEEEQADITEKFHESKNTNGNSDKTQDEAIDDAEVETIQDDSVTQDENSKDSLTRINDEKAVLLNDSLDDELHDDNGKSQDHEISDDLIETLLKDDAMDILCSNSNNENDNAEEILP